VVRTWFVVCDTSTAIVSAAVGVTVALVSNTRNHPFGPFGCPLSGCSSSRRPW
jgi:hypothetical protein